LFSMLSMLPLATQRQRRHTTSEKIAVNLT
jgi:hypothetical protein